MWTAEHRARYDRSKLRYPSDLTDEEWALASQDVSGSQENRHTDNASAVESPVTSPVCVDPHTPRLIAILQMGKVASWTVIKTVQEAAPNIKLCSLENSIKYNDAIVHLHGPREFKKYLQETEPIKQDINVITLVRDPLRRGIAALFQNVVNDGHAFF